VELDDFRLESIGMVGYGRRSGQRPVKGGAAC
jgi:hypothetical protein